MGAAVLEYSRRYAAQPCVLPYRQRSKMAPILLIMNKDQFKGRMKKVDGTIKEVIGRIIGNKSLEEKGRAQKTLGQGSSGLWRPQSQRQRSRLASFGRR
jgi:uncharacterized protein YjbJ (UPF0337 family)